MSNTTKKGFKVFRPQTFRCCGWLDLYHNLPCLSLWILSDSKLNFGDRVTKMGDMCLLTAKHINLVHFAIFQAKAYSSSYININFQVKDLT